MNAVVAVESQEYTLVATNRDPLTSMRNALITFPVLTLLAIAPRARAQLPAAWAQPALGLGFAGKRTDYTSNVDVAREASEGVRVTDAYGIEISGLTTGR